MISFLLLKGDFRVVKSKKFVAINKGRREHKPHPLPMIALGHEHLVECFFKPWYNAFQPDKNKIGWELEGVVPFTKKQLWKFREIHKTSAWTTASNHVSSRASRVTGDSGEERRGSINSVENVAPLAGKISAEVESVVQQTTQLP